MVTMIQKLVFFAGALWAAYLFGSVAALEFGFPERVLMGILPAAVIGAFPAYFLMFLFSKGSIDQRGKRSVQVVLVGFALGFSFVGIDEAVFRVQSNNVEVASYERHRCWPFNSTSMVHEENECYALDW